LPKGGSRRDEIQALLDRLTEWQRMSGAPNEESSRFRSTGESNAAIENLKRKLEELGARYRWSESANGYQLEDSEPLR
jgi:hypothetical protein